MSGFRIKGKYVSKRKDWIKLSSNQEYQIFKIRLKDESVVTGLPRYPCRNIRSMLNDLTANILTGANLI